MLHGVHHREIAMRGSMVRGDKGAQEGKNTLEMERRKKAEQSLLDKRAGGGGGWRRSVCKWRNYCPFLLQIGKTRSYKNNELRTFLFDFKGQIWVYVT